MAIFQGILLLIVILLVPMAAAAATVVGLGGAEEQHDECIMPTSCRKHHGPEIRFPFRQKGKQPDYCGGYHPSFDLSCTPPSIYPMLQLPNFVNVFVKKINYKSQTIHISDAHGCFPRQLQNLDLSASPFEFLSNYDYYLDLSFINCSQTLDQFWTNWYQIACLSDQSHQVYATDSGSFPDLSCTKMYNMTHPYEFFRYASITFDDLQLNWSKPECGNCEAQGKYCRFKNNNSSGSNSKLLLNGTTECLDKPKQPSMGVLRKLEIAGGVLGLTLFVMVVITIYLVYRSNKNEKRGSSKD